MTKPKTEDELHHRVMSVLGNAFPRVTILLRRYEAKVSGTHVSATIELLPELRCNTQHLCTAKAEAVAEAMRLLEEGVERPSKYSRALEVIEPAFPCARFDGFGQHSCYLKGDHFLSMREGRYKFVTYSATELSDAESKAIAEALTILNEPEHP